MHYFELYIYKMYFIIFISYLALKALKDKIILKIKLFKSAEKLIKYDFDIIYYFSIKNIISDFLF